MLRKEKDGAVLRLTLDRPEVRNAIDDALIAELHQAFSELDPSVRVVVLAGEGKAFCAGGDLEWMRRAANYSREENIRDALKLADLFDAIVRCPAVTVASVHGAAFGGGAGLVAAVDVAIAEDATKFAFSEVRLGLIPATISPFVVAKIGKGHARALFATGEAFAADRALRIGLIHEVTTTEGRSQAVAKVIRQVLTCGPHAIREAKRLVLESPVPHEVSAERLAAMRVSEEGREGVAAFLEKRKAAYVVE